MNFLFAITAIANLAIANDAALLSWSDPNCDSASFTVFYGSFPGVYTTQLNAEPVFSNGRYHFLVENLPDGTWYFVVTVTDLDGVESEYSNEATKTIGTPCYVCHEIGMEEPK